MALGCRAFLEYRSYRHECNSKKTGRLPAPFSFPVPSPAEKVALEATMRKLLAILNAIFRSGQSYRAPLAVGM